MSSFVVAAGRSRVMSRRAIHIASQRLKASSSRVTLSNQVVRPSQSLGMHSSIRRATPSVTLASPRVGLGGVLPRRDFSTGIGAALVAGAGLLFGGISYMFDRFRPVEMPASVMKTFGYDPANAPECPILTTPSIELVQQTIGTLGLREGDSFAGVVDTRKLGAKDAHFYLY